MPHRPKTLPRAVIWAFFLIGFCSAIAFRALVLTARYAEDWMRPCWYFGVIGYVFFFAYRYWIACRRKAVVRDYDLLRKLREGEDFSDSDREVLLYVVGSIEKSRENWNYLLIFALSVLAIAADLLLPQ